MESETTYHDSYALSPVSAGTSVDDDISRVTSLRIVSIGDGMWFEDGERECFLRSNGRRNKCQNRSQSLTR